MTPEERADWHKLGNMLGYVVGQDDNSLYSPTTGVAMLLCGDDALPEHTREAQAMLIGLACHEANGSVCWIEGKWAWVSHIHNEQGAVFYDTAREDSRPASAIAMLEAYRKDQGC